ncbi:MAG: DUF481 domain-containing protein [Planctomycetes bacterium]|nr:DUF481 domain-containing protein [Planctomycetota bacterium]
MLKLTLLAIPLLASTALAQDPGVPEQSNWSGAGSAGLIYMTGNNASVLSSADVSSKYQVAGQRWLFSGKYAAVRQTDRVTDDAITSSRLYQGSVSHHRFLDDEDNLYLYGKGSARRNVPTGLQIREDLGVGAGYTWRWKDDDAQFSLEGGPSALKENNVASASGAMALNGRAACNYENKLNEDLSTTFTAEFFQSFDVSADRSVTAEAKLRWAMNGTWHLEAGVANAWDNTPATGFEKTDWIYTIQVGTSW